MATNGPTSDAYSRRRGPCPFDTSNRFIRSERALIFELARAVGAHIVNLTEMKTCDHRHIRQACQESGLIGLMVARS